MTSCDFPAATSVGTYAFYECTSLTNASIPVAAKLGESTFQKDAALLTVTLSPTLASIGQQAFRDCSSLVTVTPLLPPTVKSIGKQCFQSCTSLKGDLRLECPELTTNPANAFQNSSSLSSIYLPYIVDMQGWVYGSLGKGIHGLVIYCDPTIDPAGWERVKQLNWANPDNAKKFCTFVTVEDDPTLADEADYPGPKTIGRFHGEDDSSKAADSYDYWLVAYRSPLRNPGLVILFF